MTVVFHHPWFLCLLLPLLLLFIVGLQQRGPAVPVNSLNSLVAVRDVFWHRSRCWFCLVTISAVWLLLGLSQPMLLFRRTAQEAPRPNLLWVLDLSGSMEAADWPAQSPPPQAVTAENVPLSRLQLARQIIADFLDRTPVARSGLVAFAHQAHLICPLQRNTSLLRERLQQLHSADFADGTAIGEAILCAIRALQAEPTDRPRCLVLLSDGADHSQGQKSPGEAARLAAENEVVIYTLGIGGQRGYHPVSDENGEKRWQPVGESLDEAQLRALAESTDGSYFPAAGAEQFLAALENLSRQIEQQVLSRPSWQRQHLRRLCLLLSGVCLVLAMLARVFFPRLES